MNERIEKGVKRRNHGWVNDIGWDCNRESVWLVAPPIICCLFNRKVADGDEG
jgi:hypothetical protein